MAPVHEKPKEVESELTNNSSPLDSTLPPAVKPNEEQEKLWEAFREQQRRRSCPGCGDDGSLF